MSDILSQDVTILKTELFDADLAGYLLRATHPNDSKKRLLGRDDHEALSRYFKKRIGSRMEVLYQVAKKVRSDGLFAGRLYPKDNIGLAALNGKIRSSLCHGIYHDIDMCQAHTAILVNICEQHRVPAPATNRVLHSRSDWMKLAEERGLTRDDVKMDITRTLFGGSPFQVNGIPEIACHLAEFKDELPFIVSSLQGHFPREVTLAKKRKGNFIGVFLNAICTDKERDILMVMDRTLTSLGYPVDVLIYDGCMVRTKEDEPELPESVLRIVEQAILDQTKFKIQLACKPLHPYFKLPDDTEHEARLRTIAEKHRVSYNTTQELANTYNSTGPEDMDVAKALAEMMEPVFRWDASESVDELRYPLYHWNGYYWKLVADEFKACLRAFANDNLRPYLEDLETYMKSVVGKIHPYSYNVGSVKHQEGCIKATKCCPSVVFHGPWNECEDLIQFETGCFSTKFGGWVECEKSNYIRGSNGIKLEFSDPQVADTAKAKVEGFFNSMFQDPNDSKWLMRFIACCALRRNLAQTVVFWVGSGSNGKSTMERLLERAFGNEYGHLAMSYFTSEAKQGADVNLFETRGKRIVMSKESSAKAKFIDGKFKVICGDDTIKCRTNYATSEVCFKMGKVIIQTNNTPKFVGGYDRAIGRRIRVLEFPYSFKKPEEINPADELQKPIDESLGAWLETDEAVLGLWTLISDMYADPVFRGQTEIARLAASPNMERATKEYISELDEISQWLPTVLTAGTARDRVSCEELRALWNFQQEVEKYDRKAWIKKLSQSGLYDVRKDRTNKYFIFGYSMCEAEMALED
jgi:hypothetical protein